MTLNPSSDHETQDHHDPDFDFEPVEGLPEVLPDGETVLWRGSPEKWRIGHRALHSGVVFGVFAILAVSSLFSSLTAEATAFQKGMQFLSILLAGGAYVGLAAMMGWLIAINTVYTITDKRLVIRHGITMPMAINVPFAKVANAQLKVGADGVGDVAVSLLDGNHVSLFAIWPHNRPWSWQGAAPAMKCIAEADKVARILHDALVAEVTREGDVYVGERPKIGIRTGHGGAKADVKSPNAPHSLGGSGAPSAA